MPKNNIMNTQNHQETPTFSPDQLKLIRENGCNKVVINLHYPDAKLITLKKGGAYIELAHQVETMPMPAYEASALFATLSTKLKLRPND